MSLEFLKDAADAVRATTPLVHCITNYVTVNDCANALLAVGASPIMSDEPDDVVDITSICGGLAQPSLHRGHACGGQARGRAGACRRA